MYVCPTESHNEEGEVPLSPKMATKWWDPQNFLSTSQVRWGCVGVGVGREGREEMHRHLSRPCLSKWKGKGKDGGIEERKRRDTPCQAWGKGKVVPMPCHACFGVRPSPA